MRHERQTWTVVKGGVGITGEPPGLCGTLLVPGKWETSPRAAAEYSSTSTVPTLQFLSVAFSPQPSNGPKNQTPGQLLAHRV